MSPRGTRQDGTSTKEANLDLIWNKVRTPDKQYCKTQDAGGFAFTTVEAMWCVRRLTELYGPPRYIEPTSSDEAEGWGMRLGEYHVINDVWYQKVSVWIRTNGSVYTSEHWGGSPLILKRRTGDRLDPDAAKKAATDGFSKAASILGVASDLWLVKDFMSKAETDKIEEEWVEAENKRAVDDRERAKVKVQEEQELKESRGGYKADTDNPVLLVKRKQAPRPGADADFDKAVFRAFQRRVIGINTQKGLTRLGNDIDACKAYLTDPQAAELREKWIKAKDKLRGK